jgi:hypothetical protein
MTPQPPAPPASGFTVRHIRTTTVTEVVDGATVTRVVPMLDANGQEIEISSIDVPLEIEAEGGQALADFLARTRLTLTTTPDGGVV